MMVVMMAVPSSTFSSYHKNAVNALSHYVTAVSHHFLGKKGEGLSKLFEFLLYNVGNCRRNKKKKTKKKYLLLVEV